MVYPAFHGSTCWHAGMMVDGSSKTERHRSCARFVDVVLLQTGIDLKWHWVIDSQESILHFQGVAWKIDSLNRLSIWVEHIQFSISEPCHKWATYRPNRTICNMAPGFVTKRQTAKLLDCHDGNAMQCVICWSRLSPDCLSVPSHWFEFGDGCSCSQPQSKFFKVVNLDADVL